MNTQSATSETLAALGGAGSPLPVRANSFLGRTGLDGIRGKDAVHNFTDKRTNLPCLVRAAVNGVAGDFVFVPFSHES